MRTLVVGGHTAAPGAAAVSLSCSVYDGSMLLYRSTRTGGGPIIVTVMSGSPVLATRVCWQGSAMSADGAYVTAGPICKAV